MQLLGVLATWPDLIWTLLFGHGLELRRSCALPFFGVFPISILAMFAFGSSFTGFSKLSKSCFPKIKPAFSVCAEKVRNFLFLFIDLFLSLFSPFVVFGLVSFIHVARLHGKGRISKKISCLVYFFIPCLLKWFLFSDLWGTPRACEFFELLCNCSYTPVGLMWMAYGLCARTCGFQDHCAVQGNQRNCLWKSPSCRQKLPC